MRTEPGNVATGGWADKSLPESDQRYRRLLASVTDYVYVVVLEQGRTVTTSHGPGCEAVTGYTPAEMEQDPNLWFRMIYEPDRPAVLAQVDQLLKGATPPPLEHRIVHKNGSTRWIRNTAVPRKNRDQLIGYDGLVSDITERKDAEQLLADERNLLRTLIDALPVYIYVKDTESRFVMNNAAHLRALGASQQKDTLGKTDLDYFPGELARRYLADEAKVLRTGLPLLNREEPVINAQGIHGWVTTTKVPLRDNQGHMIGLVGASMDETDRRRAEIALRESQERLALVIKGSSDGIWDWNMTTNDVYFSPRWKSMLGYEEQEIENRFSSWEELLHPEDRDRAIACIQSYLSGVTATYELEHRLRHKDGSYRWILSRGVALRNGEGKPVRMAGSHVDLTERKQAEEQLKQAYSELARNEQALKATLQQLKASSEELKVTQLQLIHSARLESIGSLAAGVAHEVKNPLQTILMGLDYLSRNFRRRDDNIPLVLEDMREAVARADRIVRELLQFSAPTEFELKPEDVNALLEHSLWLIHCELLATQTTVVRNLSPNLPRLALDRRKMEQVFINLFINALQAMSQGGVLTVSTRSCCSSEQIPLHSTLRHGFTGGDRLVVVEIQDTGTGIPEANLPRIFDPFFTTKPVGVGTGLGLPVVKKIIDLHGGAIDIRNTLPHGVRVTLMLKTHMEEQNEQTH